MDRALDEAVKGEGRERRGLGWGRGGEVHWGGKREEQGRKRGEEQGRRRGEEQGRRRGAHDVVVAFTRNAMQRCQKQKLSFVRICKY